MPDSRFFFTGSAVLSGVFALAGAWPLLLLSFLVMFVGLWRADAEQAHELGQKVAAMFVADDAEALLPLERFRGRELLYYQDGLPVYRYLCDGDGGCWQLQAAGAEATPGDIRIEPGLYYHRVARLPE